MFNKYIIYIVFKKKSFLTDTKYCYKRIYFIFFVCLSINTYHYSFKKDANRSINGYIHIRQHKKNPSY